MEHLENLAKKYFYNLHEGTGELIRWPKHIEQRHKSRKKEKKNKKGEQDLSLWNR